MRRRPAIVLAALAVAAMLPSTAAAHAILEQTQPLRGAIVATQPKTVSFHFNESVETVFSAVHVFNSDGNTIDDGQVVHPGGRGSDVAVGLKSNLPDGTYTATYRVISADGHPVSGGFVFSVGKPGAAPTKSVSDLTQKAAASWPIRISFDAARALQYLALALALGGLVFVFGPWFRGLRQTAGGSKAWEEASDAFARRSRGIVLAAVSLGLLASIAGILLQGATAAGVSVLSAAKPSIVQDVLGTDFGRIWGIRILIWALFGIAVVTLFGLRAAPQLRPATLSADGLAMPARFRSTPLLLFVLVPSVLLLISPAFAGHAHTEDPTWLGIPSNIVHVAGMSGWLGGLVMLLVAVPVATRRLELEDRTRLLAGVVVRFSAIAFIAILLVFASGLAQSFVLVRHIDNALHTDYGHAILIKLGLFVGILALGAINKQFVVPKLKALAAEGSPAGSTGRLLRRTITIEIFIALAVLATTGVLAGLAPATVRPSGPFAATTTLGPAELQLTVDPARVGNNLVHLYLINAQDGSQYDKVKDLSFAWSEPDKGIGPIVAKGTRAGPGHYVLSSATFGAPGKWKLVVTARLSEFEQLEQELTIPISSG
jgi:copper transport protein